MEKLNYKEAEKALDTGLSIFFKGKSGTGKTALVLDYAKKHKKKVIMFDLAGRLPEEIAGIPNTQTISNYGGYERLYPAELDALFQAEGRDYMLVFDEINQAQPETLNCIYSITARQNRRWGTHPIPYCQIVAMGNFEDGQDGNVYLTELPTPLLERFSTFELVPNQKEVETLLKKKYKSINNVSDVIKALYKENVSPRNIDFTLECIQNNYPTFMITERINNASLVAKVMQLVEAKKITNPQEVFDNCKILWDTYEQVGSVVIDKKTVINKDDIINLFKTILTDDEIASIIHDTDTATANKNEGV